MRIEQVDQREEVVLVGPAPVQQYQRALRLGARGADAVRESIRGGDLVILTA